MAFWRSPESLALRNERRKASMARIRNGEGFIYLAEVVGRRAVKIGFSLKPAERARKATPIRGGKVRLIAFVPGSIAVERALHKTLREYTIDSLGNEFYPRSILSHPAIPEGLRPAQQDAA